MREELIHDRGRGPEIVGTRITVYNLVPYFLDPVVTESEIAKLYKLTSEQVAAARAYMLNHADAVMVRHREIEAEFARGNSPEVVDRLKKTHARLLQFKEWVSRRDEAAEELAATGQPIRFPAFDEWLATQPTHAAEQR